MPGRRIMKALFLGAGALFGLLLSRARATDYDTMLALFRFQDFHIAGVMGVAIAVAALGLALLRSTGSQALIGCALEIPAKPMRKGIFASGLVFGVGWALSGA